MKREVIKYGLKLKGQEEPLQYDVLVNDPQDFCSDMQYYLCELGTNYWTTDTFEKALYVMYNPQEYYNAEYDTPTHHFKPEQLEVVQIKQMIETEEIPLKVVKIKLKDNTEDLIPNYINSNKKDTFYMQNEIGIAIDKGDYYHIVKMSGVESNIIDDCEYDKKYFDIVE